MPRELREVWQVVSPDGKAIGASVVSPSTAISDGLSHAGSTTRAALGRLMRHVEVQGVPQDRYEKDGWVVQRVSLLTPEAAAVLAAAEAMAHIIEYGEYGDDISSQSDGLWYAVKAYRAAKGEG
jgi:hypothetical protein